MIPQPGVRVRRPRILEARRHDLATFSVGDEAVIEFGPDVLRLLRMRDDRGFVIGEGCVPEYILPVSAATTAALAVVEPPGLEAANSWTGVTHRVRFERPCGVDETLIASCRLAALGRAATLPSRVFSLERGDLVAETEIVLVSVASDEQGLFVIDPRRSATDPVGMRKPTTRNRIEPSRAPSVPSVSETRRADWRPLPLWSTHAPPSLQPGELDAEDLFQLRAPRVLARTAPAGVRGAMWEWWFARDLLRLLGHPIAGSREPVGRRCHPFGLLLEGMAMHAAIGISGGGSPRSLDVTWCAPTRGEDDFSIRSTLTNHERGTVTSSHDIFEGQRAVAIVDVVIDPAVQEA